VRLSASFLCRAGVAGCMYDEDASGGEGGGEGTVRVNSIWGGSVAYFRSAGDRREFRHD